MLSSWESLHIMTCADLLESAFVGLILSLCGAYYPLGLCSKVRVKIDPSHAARKLDEVRILQHSVIISLHLGSLSIPLCWATRESVIMRSRLVQMRPSRSIRYDVRSANAQWNTHRDRSLVMLATNPVENSPSWSPTGTRSSLFPDYKLWDEIEPR
ncbi:hypothetical protein LIA77_00795 [Sarocladium implicatum]|nr:hypothetical protein LIA77_00795 [Sarocladium implicatum]